MIFYSLIVAPIEMIVDWVFAFFTRHFVSPGVIGAVAGVSLVINFLALPLYNVADSLQAKERRIAKSLEPRIKRIKKAFKGDERFMMLQTYYRENGYNPLFALRSSLSILIEIPFFIAAYHYLSHAEELKGVSFWIFKDLGSPDSLFTAGNFSVNVLPVLMTAINLVSGAVYSKDTTSRERIQIFVLAAVFLALLYNSPAGLVIYWILNNLFSLAKNIVLKMKKPGRVLHIIISTLFLLLSAVFIHKKGFAGKTLFVLAFALFVTFFSFIKAGVLLLLKKVKLSAVFIEEKQERSAASFSKSEFFFFIFSSLALALLAGFYLPSSAVATSPIEFSFLEEGFSSPLTYIKSSVFVLLGLFTVWPAAVYFMFGAKVKKWETALFFTLFIVSAFDIFIFKADYGTIDVLFQLEDAAVLIADKIQKVLPLLIALVFLITGFFILRFRKLKILTTFMLAVCIAESALSVMNVSQINKKFTAYEANRKISKTDFSATIEPVYHLSRTGKNVIVLFLDRAINSFLPYALKDLPDLKNQLKGFVYYPNTLSFYQNTDAGSPAMMAGYEYIPEKINARENELLREKHNEASLVLPVLFRDAGFESTVTDPPFPNYTWKGDLSAFRNQENIRAAELFGKYTKNFKIETNYYEKNAGGLSKKVSKQIRSFSLLQILPPVLRKFFYTDFVRLGKTADDYLDMISTLYFLPELTDFEAEKSQFIFIDNEACHTPVLLDENFLLPQEAGEENLHGAHKTTDIQAAVHYQSFTAAFKQIGKWLDFLKQNGVYDNTRIIIVSDHGYPVAVNDFKNFSNPKIPASYNALLMYKDFNASQELKTETAFMTNADTLFLAKEGLNLAEENPFTHKKFTVEKEGGITVYPSYKLEWNAEKMIHKTKFTLDRPNAFHVKENIFDEKNWIPLEEWEKSQSQNLSETGDRK